MAYISIFSDIYIYIFFFWVPWPFEQICPLIQALCYGFLPFLCGFNSWWINLLSKATWHDMIGNSHGPHFINTSFAHHFSIISRRVLPFLCMHLSPTIFKLASFFNPNLYCPDFAMKIGSGLVTVAVVTLVTIIIFESLNFIKYIDPYIVNESNSNLMIQI